MLTLIWGTGLRENAQSKWKIRGNKALGWVPGERHTTGGRVS